MNDWTYYLETFGCRVNQHESQAIREAWTSLGGREISRPETADVILLNSCAITSHAERDARNALFKLRKAAPKAKIILTGCAAQFFEDFRPYRNAAYAQPDLILPQSRKQELLNGPWPEQDKRIIAGQTICGVRSYTRARPVIKIQDGCRQNCSYCIVPQSRNQLVSVDREEILRQCVLLLESGYAELVLSGVNLRHYGVFGGKRDDFWDMLVWLNQQLESYADHARIRISSLEPGMLGPKALDALGNASLLCPHLHLSLQHAAPGVLRRMGRGHYDMARISSFLGRLADIWPVFGLGADILVGFPGETENDFGCLMDFVADIPLSYAHVFPFSARQGTVAAKMADQLPQKIRHARAARLRRLIAVKQEKFCESLLGLETVTVVADKPEPGETGSSCGVNEFYVQCVAETGSFGQSLCRVKPVALAGRGLVTRVCKGSDEISA